MLDALPPGGVRIGDRSKKKPAAFWGKGRCRPVP